MNKLKYVIVSPRWNTGGAIALHSLCKNLIQNGEEAKMFYVSRFIYKKDNHLKWWIHWVLFTIKDLFQGTLAFFLGADKVKGYIENSVKNCKRKILPFISKKTIVIYPEVIYGNPFGAKKVVRWLLYYYGKYYPDADESWGDNFSKDDLVFCYRSIFNVPELNPLERTLCTPYFDLDLYKQTNFNKRKGKCYIIRKGSGRNDLPKSFDGIIIDDLPEEEKVRVFNECKYCISYDTQTAYSVIASICGCISVVVPEEGKHREDYRKNEDVSYGVAFGFLDEEIQHAMDTRAKLKEYYNNINSKSKKTAEQFILECENYFTEH